MRTESCASPLSCGQKQRGPCGTPPEVPLASSATSISGGHSLLLIHPVRGREFFFKGTQGFGERTQCPVKHTLCHGYSHTVIGDLAAGGSSRPYTGEHLSQRNDAAPAVNYGLIRLRIEGKLLSGRDRNIQLSPCQLTEQSGKLDPITSRIFRTFFWARPVKFSSA